MMAKVLLNQSMELDQRSYGIDVDGDKMLHQYALSTAIDAWTQILDSNERH
ncbi:hypothetical protein OH492_08535 [Vibrio chagasii]|nr:hypothetical protein [Vibrio chagasii]